MCQNHISEEKYAALSAYIDSLPDKNIALIAVLHKAQEIFKYLPKEVQCFIAEKLDIPVSKVYGVVTFYSYFTTEPRGEHVINVCMGTACFVRGAASVLEEFQNQLNIKVGETTADGRFTLEVLRCVGACGLAPVVTIDDRVYGHFTKDQVSKLLTEYSR